MTHFVSAVGLLAILALVALNAFFVAAEFSLVTVRRTRVEQLVMEGRFGATFVREAIRHLDDAIAATQLGITFASLALGWIGEPTLARLIGPLFVNLPDGWGPAATHGLAVGIAFILLTFMHVVLGELAPKGIALQRAEDVALLVAGPLLVFGRVFRPLIWMMNGAGNWVVRLLRLPPVASVHRTHSAAELQMLVEETRQSGAIPRDQAMYLQNVFRLSDKRVRDIMVPRDRVVALPISASEEHVLEVARNSAHTRMPVWEGSLDNIVGVVNTKDLFHLFSLRGLVVLMDAMYPPLFVDADQSVSQLLRFLKQEHRPMAVVRGAEGFLGIVTLEDIVEDIVGEIEDEHDVGLSHGRST